MWFDDDQKAKHFGAYEDEEADHDGFPDVISDAVYALCGALICCAVALAVWAFKNGMAQ